MPRSTLADDTNCITNPEGFRNFLLSTYESPIRDASLDTMMFAWRYARNPCSVSCKSCCCAPTSTCPLSRNDDQASLNCFVRVRWSAEWMNLSNLKSLVTRCEIRLRLCEPADSDADLQWRLSRAAGRFACRTGDLDREAGMDGDLEAGIMDRDTDREADIDARLH